MLSASKIKWVKALSQKKFRKQEGLFVVEGDKIVKELLQSNWEIIELLALGSWFESNTLPGKIHGHSISAKELERISSLTTPNQVVAVVRIPVNHISTLVLGNNYSLMLDNIQDPGNMGTILRTADWFGINNIICSENTADIFNPKVIQATMGSFIRTRVFYTDTVKFLKEISGRYPIMGAMLDGESIFSTRLPAEGILVIGNESRGISPEIDQYISHKVFIPRGDQNQQLPESLNAGVAAAIIMSQLMKQGI
jgi:RNA methyltransferase, TrmH family